MFDRLASLRIWRPLRLTVTPEMTWNFFDLDRVEVARDPVRDVGRVLDAGPLHDHAEDLLGVRLGGVQQRRGDEGVVVTAPRLRAGDRYHRPGDGDCHGGSGELRPPFLRARRPALRGACARRAQPPLPSGELCAACSVLPSAVPGEPQLRSNAGPKARFESGRHLTRKVRSPKIPQAGIGGGRAGGAVCAPLRSLHGRLPARRHLLVGGRVARRSGGIHRASGRPRSGSLTTPSTSTRSSSTRPTTGCRRRSRCRSGTSGRRPASSST